MRYSSIVVTLSAFALSAVALGAQVVGKAHAFLPVDHHNRVFIDLDALRESGVWDALGSGPMKLMVGQFEQQLGMDLESIDRFTFVPMAAAKTDGVRSGSRHQQILVIESRGALELPDSVLRDESYTEEKIGDHDVRRKTQWGDEVFFQPSPGVQVMGHTDLLRSVLEGEKRAGAPCADILSLLSSRQKGLLFHAVVHLEDMALNDDIIEGIHGDVEWPEGGQPRYMFIGLSAIGDPDDPNVQAELVFRHARGGDNVALTQGRFDDLIAQAKAIPQVRLLKPVLDRIVTAQDQSDLTYRVDLGRAREAAGTLAMGILPFFMLGTTDAPAGAALVEEAEPAPKPVEPKAEPKKEGPKKAGPKKAGPKKGPPK